MYIEIHLNADELTDQDRAILTAIGNAGLAASIAREAPVEEAKPETPKKRAPRKPKLTDPGPTELGADGELENTTREEEVAQAAAEEAAKVAAEKESAAAKAAAEEEKVDPKDLINDAAQRAVKLIRAGKRDEIKAILDGMGLEKVTALKDSPELVHPFLDSISKLED